MFVRISAVGDLKAFKNFDSLAEDTDSSINRGFLGLPATLVVTQIFSLAVNTDFDYVPILWNVDGVKKYARNAQWPSHTDFIKNCYEFGISRSALGNTSDSGCYDKYTGFWVNVLNNESEFLKFRKLASVLLNTCAIQGLGIKFELD